MTPDINSDEQIVAVKRSTEKLLNRLQQYHQDHDVPGIDDVDLTPKEQKHERTSFN